MGKFRLFTHTVILATTSTFLIYPEEIRQTDFRVQEIHSRVPKNFRKTKRYHLASYDDILNFLKEIESGTVDYREKDLRRINRFLSYLASESVLPNTENAHDLKKDIEDLLEDSDYTFTDWYEEGFAIIPAVGGEEADIVLCRSKLSKKWKKTKKFLKRHKREIIIGAIIVVATATVVFAIVATSSAGAAAAAAGAAGAASSPSKSDEEEKSKRSEAEISDISRCEDTCDVVEAINESPTVKAAIDEHASSFKEFMIEDQLVQQLDSSQEWDDLSFGEKAREVGAYFAHQAYEEVAGIVSVVPELCDEIKDLGSELLSEDLTPSNNELIGDPKANFENLMTKGHNAIDALFATDQADLFTAEDRANGPMDKFSIGELPFPGGVLKNFSNTAKLIEKGKALDKAGYTVAGRGLMKHGYREGSAFPKPLGNPKQINEHGQKVLESIVNHPERKIICRKTKNYGEIVDIYAPGIGGVRYYASGELIGFLEP